MHETNNVYRGTNFRGVSKNGRCNWQILTMIDGEKVYVGTVDNIYKAAIIYDIVSIQTKGHKAKTNFLYRKSELLAILMLNNLMNPRDKNISELVSHMPEEISKIIINKRICNSEKHESDNEHNYSNHVS